MSELEKTAESRIGRVSTAHGRLLLVPLVAIVLVTVLLYPFSFGGRSWSAIFDLAHAPSFLMTFLFIVGVLDPGAIGIPGRLPPIAVMSPRRIVILAIALCIVGAICEYLQTLVGRGASIVDALANASGILAGMFWCVSCEAQHPARKISLALIAPALVAMMSISPTLELLEARNQRNEFPLLASFERSRERTAWNAHDAQMEIVSEWASDGKQSLKLTGTKGRRFPGASMTWPMWDWSGFTALRFDVRNPGDTELQLGVNISDRMHPTTNYNPTDRFHKVFIVAPASTQTIMIDLIEVASAPATREMNMSEIALVDIHMAETVGEASVLVDNLRLMK